MPHFVYTKEGAAEALGLKKMSSISRYIKKATTLGVKPSKNIGGSEYFDIDLLKNPPKQQNKENLNLEKFVEKQIKERKRNKTLQLRFFFD